MNKLPHKALRLCAVTTWPPYREGIALYSAKLYRETARLAHVEVIANKVGASASNIHNEDGIVVRRVWSRGSIFSPLRVIKHVVKSEADLVHVQYGWLLYGYFSTALFPFFLLAVRLTKRPVILTMHTVIKRNAKIYNNTLLNQITGLAIFALTKLLTEFSCKVIVHNQLMKKELEENYGCKSGKVVIIPHGVVKADLEYPSENSSSGNLTILSLGFLRQEKKLEYLIQGFCEFSKGNSNAKLLLVGDRHPHDADKYVEKIAKLVSDSELAGKVRMIDFASDEDLNQLISNSDFIILLSTKDYFIETSGTLARVADFGKPVVCTKVPKFLGELKDGHDCLMVTPGNVDELVKAMKTLADNHELKRQLASNLKIYFSKRYWTDVAKMHLSCYYSCLKSTKK